MKIPWQLIFVVVALAIGGFAPRLGDRLFGPIERLGARLARRKRLSICMVILATALTRVALLSLYPVPFPEQHDEFSYLLAGDTFAHGRLTNPPHPMWIYFETFHVNQHPTYMSKYPPAQGAFLALGEVLGNPWIGVVISVSLMCGAILWMLQGWLPPEWALLGGVLAVLRLGVFSYWMNSYWGGAAAAIGGALVVGALPRIMRFHRARDAVLLALGAAILANSRPFEGLVFCVPVAIALVVWMCGRRSPAWRKTAARIILPAFAVLAATVVFMGYYNWRGTGHASLLPYVLNSRTYMSQPDFAWETGRAPLHYLNPQFEAFYNGWCRKTAFAGRANSIPQAWRVIRSDVSDFGGFFLWPDLCVPLIALPWIVTDRRVRFLVYQFAFCFFAFFLVVWFQPHYAAPLTATTFALLTQGFRHIRRWTFRGMPVGIGVVRAAVLCVALLAPFHTSFSDLQFAFEYRARIAAQLNAKPGGQLVIVRYSPLHVPIVEWVYNGADIDNAKVVWAREIPGVSMQPLLDYFHGRHVWMVDPDRAPHLVPYASSAGSLNGARAGTETLAAGAPR